MSTEKARNFKASSGRGILLDTEDNLSSNVLALIRLDYMVFLERLTDEAVKECHGTKLTKEDVDRVLMNVLQEFRG